ncbi:MAG TPA: universal stress protein [Methylibium sp.]
MKILLAVDGSSYTKQMLAYLAAHDEWLGTAHQYTVAYAQLELPNGLLALLSEAAIRERHEADAEMVFKPIRSFLEMQSIHAQFVHQVGAPGKVIAGLAEAGKFDLIMMGSHGHGALGGMVLGSTTTKVLALCKTPVLVVR